MNGMILEIHRLALITAMLDYIKENGLTEEEKANPFVMDTHLRKWVDEKVEKIENKEKEKAGEDIQHVGYDDEQCGREK